MSGARSFAAIAPVSRPMTGRDLSRENKGNTQRAPNAPHAPRACRQPIAPPPHTTHSVGGGRDARARCREVIGRAAERVANGRAMLRGPGPFGLLLSLGWATAKSREELARMALGASTLVATPGAQDQPQGPSAGRVVPRVALSAAPEGVPASNRFQGGATPGDLSLEKTGQSKRHSHLTPTLQPYIAAT